MIWLSARMIVIFQILLSLCLAKTWKNTSCLQKKQRKSTNKIFIVLFWTVQIYLLLKAKCPIIPEYCYKCFSSCNVIFCHTFHANLDAHLKKLLKQKKFTNLRLSISSISFKAKINIEDAPAAGKQSTMDYDLAKKILIQNAWKYSHKRKQEWKIM